MGTDKRERQKANRQLKLEEMAKDARSRKTKRRALQIGLGIPLLVALVFGLVWLFGDDEDTPVVTADTSIPAEVTTTTAATDSSTAETVPETTIGTPPPTIAGGALPCPPADGSAERVVEFPAAPPMCIDPAKTYTAQVDTNLGSYTVALDATKAPLAVNNFVYLAGYHYFDNTICPRVVPNFVIQCGTPNGTTTGGPGYTFADELPAEGEYQLGSLAMANSGADTNGSQFFVITGDNGVALPPNYTLFGQVTEGLDTTIAAISALAVGDGPPSSQVVITGVTVTES